MTWNVEYTDEFGLWWETLSEKEQVSVAASVKLLELLGPALRFPHCSDIKGARYGNLRELRVQHGGRTLPGAYAFDPRRCALLLTGGDKTGHDRWYEENVPLAEILYEVHLQTLIEEGQENG
ncbi:type II toxin-antitoxin system RelE/ParE family toxin [Pseudomonas fragi]|uniref:type II toxin-antitoxin system RelE/ParE family toxin n=1 Tax=Pseudomonas fragi TaxID=296 RepID=UPI000BA28B7B|nr:type II toxin-antitoxin system RelE/ParE family toxin [Pseudomonas fragi]PAA16714.1 addiction module toxin RelE [Pseudomonas fragi]